MARIENTIVAFIGPEGAGKSTLADRLAKDTKKPYVSTSAILHNLADHDETEVGQACRDMFERNAYLDPDLMVRILTDRLRKPDLAGGFVLDGGFRTVKESQGFRLMLQAAERDIPVTVVHLRIPGWKSMERLVIGPNARHRKDDTVDGVLSRLSKFYDHLGERASAIRSQPDWRLLHINAMGSLDETYNRVQTALK